MFIEKKLKGKPLASNPILSSNAPTCSPGKGSAPGAAPPLSPATLEPHCGQSPSLLSSLLPTAQHDTQPLPGAICSRAIRGPVSLTSFAA